MPENENDFSEKENQPESSSGTSSAISNPKLYGKLPVRVKSGAMTDDCLHIITSCDEKDIEWASIEYICLGAIDEATRGTEAPKSNMRKVFSKIFFGEQSKDEIEKAPMRTSYVIDIYTKNQECAFRLDSSNINYKSFLEDVSYMSFHNFKILLQKLVDNAKNSYFNKSAIALLLRKKDKIQRYSSIYDFELDTQRSRLNVKKEIHWNELSGPVEQIFKDTERVDLSLDMNSSAFKLNIKKTGGACDKAETENAASQIDEVNNGETIFKEEIIIDETITECDNISEKDQASNE